MATLAVSALMTAGSGSFAVAMAVASIVDSSLIMPSLFPPDPIEGNKIDSIDVMGADEGSPLPECYGTRAKTGGHLIWTHTLSSRTTTSGSRKRGITVNNEYYIDCAIAICYTPKNPLASVDQVQMDEKVIYRNSNTTVPTTVNETGMGAYVKNNEHWIFFDSTVNSSIIADVYNTFEVGDVVTWGGGGGAGNKFSNSANNDSNDVILNKGDVGVRYIFNDGSEDQPKYVYFKGFKMSKGKTNEFVETDVSVTGGTNEDYPSGLAGAVQLEGVAGSGWSIGMVVGGDRNDYMQFHLGDQTADDTTMDDHISTSELPAFKDIAYLSCKNLALRRWGQRIPNTTFIVSAHSDYRTVPTIISQILQNGNISTNDFDVSNCASTTVIGYTVKGATELIKKLQPLMLCFNIVAQERGNKIFFYDRASVPSITVNSGYESAYVGSATDGVEIEETPYSERIGEINLKFVDSDSNEYKGGQERIVFHNDGISDDNFQKLTKLNMELPITMSRSTAKSVASRLLYSTHSDVLTFKFNLPLTYLHVQENDKLTITANGTEYKVLVKKVDIGANGLVGIEATHEVATDTDWSSYG